QGYAGATASEVAISSGSGSEGVRSLWVLPYHRLGLMHPHAVVAGWGHAEIAGRTATVGVLVYDFASPSPDRVRSPAAGQRVPATWSGGESLGALRQGFCSRPVRGPAQRAEGQHECVELIAGGPSARIREGPDLRVTDPLLLPAHQDARRSERQAVRAESEDRDDARPVAPHL